jgi:hypothetical protein
VLVATAIGAGIGAGLAAAGNVSYKAEAKVVVQAKGGPAVVRPLLPNVRELATSSLLAGNVDSTLRLPGSPDDLQKRIHASVAPGSQVVVVAVADSERERARQITQETAVVLAQLVSTRFRTPPLQATVLDPAHIVAHHGRHYLRDGLIGAAVGLAVSGAALGAARRGTLSFPTAAPTDERLAARERQLKERLALVTRRERELAKRAGELARRERAIADREAVPEAAPPEPVAVEPELPPPVVEPAAAPEPVPVAGDGALPTLDTLERLVRDRAAEFPERAQEWSDYLFFLREHAGADGRLSANFSGLVHDVFGDLLR